MIQTFSGFEENYRQVPKVGQFSKSFRETPIVFASRPPD
jgi:hypothetical protein